MKKNKLNEHAGYSAAQMNPFLPNPRFRKYAERGYLQSLGYMPIVDQDAAQKCAAYAILALLDGEPGQSEFRLFRGHLFGGPDRWRDYHGESVETDLFSSGDRLPLDEISDVRFVHEAAQELGIDLLMVFKRLYSLLRSSGVDTRPIWRRQNANPWPSQEPTLGGKGVKEKATLRRIAVPA